MKVLYGLLVLAGIALFGLTDIALGSAVGYSFIAGGTLLLFVGGARGGGYTNIGVGAVEALVSGRNRQDDDYVDDKELRRGKVNKRRDPMERLRRGLRPPANPNAFWQAIAGLAFLLIGFPLR